MRRSKIDELGIGDQVLLWAMNHDVRTIAKKVRETSGTTVSHMAIQRYISLRKEVQPALAEAKAEAITKVTKELLEGEWGQSLVEIRENYLRSKNEDDSRGMADWMARWQKHIEMILRLYRPPETAIAVGVQVNQGEGLRERLWKVLGGP